MIGLVVLVCLGYELFDTTNYKYLLQYEPDIVSYQDLSVRISGGGSFYYYEQDYVNEYSVLSYSKRYYSHKFDYLLRVNPFQYISKRSEDGRLDIGLNISGFGKYYPISKSIFGSIYGNLTNTFRRDSLNKSSISFEFTTGIGIGRIIPLTPMDKALRIEHELIEQGVISNSFSIKDLLQIADQVGKRAEYDDPRDFWRELEYIITKSEKIDDDRLGAVPTIRIRNIIQMPSFLYRKYKVYSWLRSRGYEGEVYFGYIYRDPFPSPYHKKTEKSYIGLRFNYSYPLSRKIQFTFASPIEFFLSDSIYLRRSRVRMELSYEIFNRFFTSLEANFFKEYYGKTYNYIEGWISSLEFRYYIEYKMSIFTRFDILYSKTYENYRGGISIGFTYRFF